MRAKEFIVEGNSFSGVIPNIKYMPTKDITPVEDMSTQKQNLKWWLEDSPGKTKEDWARSMLNFKNGKPTYEPVPVVWDGSAGWEWKIFDGHHRLLACMILGIPLRVTLTASLVSASQIHGLLSGYNDIGFNATTGDGNLE